MTTQSGPATLDGTNQPTVACCKVNSLVGPCSPSESRRARRRHVAAGTHHAWLLSLASNQKCQCHHSCHLSTHSQPKEATCPSGCGKVGGTSRCRVSLAILKAVTPQMEGLAAPGLVPRLASPHWQPAGTRLARGCQLHCAPCCVCRGTGCVCPGLGCPDVGFLCPSVGYACLGVGCLCSCLGWVCPVLGWVCPTMGYPCPGMGCLCPRACWSHVYPAQLHTALPQPGHSHTCGCCHVCALCHAGAVLTALSPLDPCRRGHG